MFFEELFDKKIILETKKNVWSRKNGKLSNKTNEERPARNVLFNDKFVKTKIRVKHNG